jgi:hypothetical protein
MAIAADECVSLANLPMPHQHIASGADTLAAKSAALFLASASVRVVLSFFSQL